MIDLNDDLYKAIMDIVYKLDGHIAIEAIGSDGFALGYKENVPMLSASLIKLPILLYVYKGLNGSSDMLNQTITLSKNQIVGGSGVLQVLSAHEWKVKDLLALMINVSDNTATNLIMDFFGIDPIQAWIEEQGLVETRVERKMMDEFAQQEGRTNWISAHDANWMIRRIFSKSDPLPDEVQSWLVHQQFRDKLPGLFDEKIQPVTVYNKTGEMENIDHDAAYFYCNGHSMALTVMTSGLENRQDALFAIQKIGNLAAHYLIELSKSVG
ncbi:serine hydrolase [Sporolactobacillus nakayamae]|uniref:Beta-lactamase class A n=1 Tax=Sporolactobacillus nakayamae TaxID=269670 RepID=A0A1I2N3J3_9BACL|nr:serine hydrolase [Sporolactobacillus nakayamae]SFF98332.1 beta-lactamase class A [Sporolactobacillus nakayamae]